jgi:TP901 family phage tail tape measure protein
MANIQLNIVALGDFTNVNTQIKALQTQVQSLQKSIAGVGLNANLSTQLKNIQTEFSNALVSSGNFTKQTVQLTSETEKFGQALQSGKLKLGDYFGIITGRSAAVQKSVQALALEQVKLNNSIVQQDITKQGLYSVYTPTAINQTSKAVEIAAAKQNIFNLAVREGSNQLINFGKNTQWAGRQLTVGLSVPAILFGSQAVASFKAVNTELTRLQRLYGEGLTPPSQAQINQISSQVLNLGKNIASSMGIAQSETVKVAANFAAMGKEGQALLDITTQTQRLSKLGAIDATQATNTIVSLQNVYKVSTNDLANAVNFMSSMQKQTTMSLQDMTDAIPRVGPIMAQLGGSYKDTAVMLLAMREAGVPAAQAANALKSAFASMIAPTSAASKEFAKFGVNLDSIKNAGSPVKMLMSLQSALVGIAPLAREQLIEKLFGKFQFARVSALLDNFGKVGSQTQNALKVAGATNAQLATLAGQEMAQATESTTAKWQRAIETLKADLYPIGQKILEVGTKIVDFGQKIADFFNKLPGPIKSGLGILLTLGVIAGPIIMITGLFANLMGQVMKVGYSLLGIIDGSKKWKDLMTPAGIAAKTATEIFQTGLLENVTAVDTLNAALQRLIVSIESINIGMNGVSGTSLLAKAEAGIAGGKIPFKAPGFASGGIVPGNPAQGDIYPALLTGGEAVIPQQQATMYSPFINAMISGTLPMHARGRRAGEVGIQSIGSNIESAQSLGLPIDKEGSRFARGEDASYRGTFTAATPSSEFNSRLTGGTANPQEWLDFANKEGGRGARANSGLYQFLKQQSTVSDTEKAEILSHAHEIITEHFSNLAKEGKTLSDQEFSKAFSNANDTALGNLLNKDSVVKENYLRETSAIGSASTPGTRRPNGKISGISISSIKDPFSTMQDYRKTGINERKEFNDEAVQSHVVHPNLLKRVIGARSSNLNVYGAEGVLSRSEIDALEGSTKTVGSNLINGIKTSAKQTAKIKSPSETFEKEVGIPIAEGVAKGVDEGINGSTGQSKIQSAFNRGFGANSRLSGMMSKFSNMGVMGRMGVGMAAGTIGQMASPLINQLPGGSFISSAISGGSMGAGFGPWGIAAGAALSLVTHGITTLIAAEKQHAAEAKADFTSSANAVEFLGGKVVDATSHLQNLNIILNNPTSGTANSTKVLGANIAYTNQQLDSFTNMVKNLPKDNPLSLVIQQIKDAGDSGSAAKIASEFATLQMAINNITPDQAKQLQQLILSVGGKDASAARTPVANQIDAITSSLNSALPKSKEFAQVIGQITSSALNSNSLDSVNMAIKAIGASSATAEQQVAGLLLYFTQLGNSGAIQLITAMKNAGGFSGGDILKTLDAYQAGAKISFPTLSSDLKSGVIDKTLTAANESRNAKIKEISALQDKLNKLQNENTSSTIANGAAIKANLPNLTAQQKVLDANLKSLQDLQKQQNQNISYATTKEDLKNQILMAQSIGDNLKAQLLQQQLLQTTSGYNLQNKIDAAQQSADKNKLALDNANLAATNAQTSASNALTKAINDLQAQIAAAQKGLDTPTPGAFLGVPKIAPKPATKFAAIAANRKAAGGTISGPGSSTSDSIPAMLSNGEYVVNAGAVSHYGKGTFDALNARHLAKGGVARTNSSITYHKQHMNRIARHFASGGYVPSSVSGLMSLSSFPHFAAGGAVNSINAGTNVVYNVNVSVDKIDSTVDMKKAIDEALKSAESRAKMSGRISRVGV